MTELRAVRLATAEKVLDTARGSLQMEKRTVTDTVHVIVREDGALAEICQSTCLFNKGGWEAVSVGHIMDQLGRHIVPKIILKESMVSRVSWSDRCATYRVLHSGLSAEDEVTDIVEERRRLLLGLLELVGSQNLLHVVLEGLNKA
jgi:hypothetical protein